ncbi:MAG: ABC-F family ATP-binding cassette domain-containing protein [Kiritimatiellae bacterium]|nr:ABC-F family ATP-binding cassette domain-containing protein [Kiritimatiellia bacterium]
MIAFKQVSKSFGAQQILKNVSFFVGAGERVGIVGPNGAGKSTVFHLIGGELSPDAGVVDVQRSARIAHLHQEFDPRNDGVPLLDYVESGRPDLRGILAEIHELEEALQRAADADRAGLLARLGELQTRFESNGGYETGARAEAALCGLGFGVDTLKQPFRQFSGGWQMRAELARVLIGDPDILLLDEPTNYLDIPAVEWLQKYLKGFAGTLVLISHDRYLLNTLTRTTLEIANGQATRYAGNYDFYVGDREARYTQQFAAMKNQQRERERAERFIERFRAKNTKASQVQSRIKMLERMDVIELPHRVLSPGTIRLKKPPRSGREVVRLDGAGATYDGTHWVLRDVDLSLQRGEKIAVVGLNGMGKTTLLRLLAGLLKPAAGKRVLGHKAVVGYQSQEFADTMDPDRTVLETVKAAGAGASEEECRTLLGGFGFSGDTVTKKVMVLSGGEKVRLAFARLLIDPPNFLLLDEPTTHLDVSAREALEQALAAFEGTLCLVSHDIEFVRHVATGILAMAPPGVRRYHGGYAYYREKLDAESAGAQAQAAPAPQPQPDSRKARRRERAQIVQQLSRRKKPLEAKIDGLEKRIEELEREQADLTAGLTQHAANTDYRAVHSRLQEIQRELDKHTRQWERYAYELERLLAEFEGKLE